MLPDQQLVRCAGHEARGTHRETTVKNFMILSVALFASGGGAALAGEAASNTPVEETSEDIDDAEVAALMAPASGLGTDALSGRIRETLQDAVSSQEVSNQLAQIPGVQERVRQRFRKELPAKYPDLGDVVGLTPPQVEKFYDLLTKQNDEARTSTATAQDRAKKEEAQISTLLGSKYPKWQAYKTGLPARLQVRDLNAALIAYDLELSDPQMETLMSALTAALKQGGPDMGSFSPENKALLVAAATPHLSPEQLEVYQKVLDRYTTRARSQSR
jgi:hypothetical protein